MRKCYGRSAQQFCSFCLNATTLYLLKNQLLLLGFMKINSQTFKIFLVKSYLIKDYVNMIIDLIQKMLRERDGDDILILTL